MHTHRLYSYALKDSFSMEKNKYDEDCNYRCTFNTFLKNMRQSIIKHTCIYISHVLRL